MNLVLLVTGDELRTLVIEKLSPGLIYKFSFYDMRKSGMTYVESVWALAECGVVLLDEIPADLVLWDFGRGCVVGGLAGCGLLGRAV